MKKFEAHTEQDAIEKAQQELGLDVIILSSKTLQPRGFFAFLRKQTVEVTAAYDEKLETKNAVALPRLQEDTLEQIKSKITAAASDRESELQKEKIEMLQNKLTIAEDMLQKATSQLQVMAEKRPLSGGSKRKYENTIVQMFYEALVEQEVLPQIAENLLASLDQPEGALDMTTVVTGVYDQIVNILTPQTEENSESNQLYMFIGPTGVGKTTTIAKLSSLLVLEQGHKVSFITADTYRIAAVEQLRVYADILGAEVGVVYNSADLEAQIERLRVSSEVIMIDTAGRSHKNSENMEELTELLAAAQGAEKLLLLSATTKYADMQRIVEAYDRVTDFKIIFTKLDETSCLGPILNICYMTGKEVAYVANGQNVPDDIERLKPKKIAKVLMGLGGVVS